MLGTKSKTNGRESNESPRNALIIETTDVESSQTQKFNAASGLRCVKVCKGFKQKQASRVVLVFTRDVIVAITFTKRFLTYFFYFSQRIRLPIFSFESLLTNHQFCSAHAEFDCCG